MALAQVRWPLLVVISLFVCECMGGCAEVDSKTEAVRGEAFVLGCISCKRREEVSAITTLDWHFKPQREENYTHIFHYEHPTAEVLDEAFMGRLDWLGTLGEDVQAGTVAMHNISYDDAGTYRCTFTRTLLLAGFRQHVTVEKEVELSVVDVANRELAAVVSEMIMYALIVLLQLWLIVVVVYCYKKVSEDMDAREARRALKEHRELLDCDGVSLEEGK
ncbi:sodium channel subunit beta-1-like [Corythoichthys intestinalis]|uniref:sodium channel subunit beta-1-like n=1 Tax=Corythoichthys intestinalis TaxID=161448 RepID=UPI0025A52FAE|nr:sodium channel subunit beta-1-like [Corythoichthys intestinalis]